MRRSVALLVVAVCVGSALPASADARTLSIVKTKQVLQAYAESQRSLDFSVRYCRRRSPNYVRCIVREVFVEPLFELRDTYTASERYPMAVKQRRRTSRTLMIYDDIKGHWVRWNGRTP